MFVNTITWPHRGFGQLAAYITKERGTEEDYGLEVFHNVWASDDLQEITRQFAENDAFRPRRKGQTGLVHEILSFSGDDRERITPEIIRDVAERWLQERSPRGLAYGCVHQDRAHLHLHLMISANEYRSERSTRLDLKDFYRLRREIEFYTREQYPEELAHSVAYTGWMDTPKHERITKERAADILSETLAQSRDIDQVNAALAEHGLEVYWYRDRPAGIRQDGRKFRWSRLGIEPPAFEYPDPDLERQGIGGDPAPAERPEETIGRDDEVPVTPVREEPAPANEPPAANEPRFDYTFEAQMWERELAQREADRPPPEVSGPEESTEGVPLNLDGGEGLAGKVFLIGEGLFMTARSAVSLVGTGIRIGKHVAQKGISMIAPPEEKKPAPQMPSAETPAETASSAPEKDDIARQLLADIRRFRESQSHLRDRSRGDDYDR